jgi:hypothetical protein
MRSLPWKANKHEKVYKKKVLLSRPRPLQLKVQGIIEKETGLKRSQ